MLQRKVLVLELLAIDGNATSAVVLGEVAALEHEVGDDAVEGRLGVAMLLGLSGQFAEVLGGLGDHVVKELECDAALLRCGERRRELVSLRDAWIGRRKDRQRKKENILSSLLLMGLNSSFRTGPTHSTSKKL